MEYNILNNSGLTTTMKMMAGGLLSFNSLRSLPVQKRGDKTARCAINSTVQVQHCASRGSIVMRAQKIIIMNEPIQVWPSSHTMMCSVLETDRNSYCTELNLVYFILFSSELEERKFILLRSSPQAKTSGTDCIKEFQFSMAASPNGLKRKERKLE
jgi:hypothetical protein